MATWFPMPGVARNTQATSIATTIASRTTQLCGPSSRLSPVAITTPTITPRLRSIALANDWFTLGSTTSRAAIAANTGSGPGTSQPAISHAPMVATADFTTCSRGARFALRTADVIRMHSR
jgi:hypothetical protein